MHSYIQIQLDEKCKILTISALSSSYLYIRSSDNKIYKMYLSPEHRISANKSDFKKQVLFIRPMEINKNDIKTGM